MRVRLKAGGPARRLEVPGEAPHTLGALRQAAADALGLGDAAAISLSLNGKARGAPGAARGRRHRSVAAAARLQPAG